MEELWKSVLTAAVTILVGVTVYVSGQLLSTVALDPLRRLRGLIGEVQYTLVFYANVYTNLNAVTPPVLSEASMTFRRQASQLRSESSSIWWYPFWSKRRLVPTLANITEASTELIGLSNGCCAQAPGMVGSQVRDNDAAAKKIKALLTMN